MKANFTWKTPRKQGTFYNEVDKALYSKIAAECNFPAKNMYELLYSLHNRPNDIPKYMDTLIKKGMYLTLHASIKTYYYDYKKASPTVQKLVLAHGALIDDNQNIQDPCNQNIKDQSDLMLVLMRLIALDTNNTIITILDTQDNLNTKDNLDTKDKVLKDKIKSFWFLLKQLSPNDENQLKQLYIHAIIHCRAQPYQPSLPQELRYRYQVLNKKSYIEEFTSATKALYKRAYSTYTQVCIQKLLLQNQKKKFYTDCSLYFKNEQ